MKLRWVEFYEGEMSQRVYSALMGAPWTLLMDIEHCGAGSGGHAVIFTLDGREEDVRSTTRAVELAHNRDRKSGS